MSDARLPHNLSPKAELAEVRAVLDRVATERDDCRARCAALERERDAARAAVARARAGGHNEGIRTADEVKP